MATEVFDRPPSDPGTRTSRLIALMLALLLGGGLLVTQNLIPVRAVFEAMPEVAAESAEVPPPWAGDPMSLAGRFAIRSKGLPAGFAGEPGEILKAVDAYARTPEARVRGAIVAAELVGVDEAVDRLEDMRDSFDPDGALAADVEDLLAIYRAEAVDGVSGRDVVPESAADRLMTHHGYFGEVALSHGLADSDPAREPLITGGGALLALMMGLLVGLAIVALLGFAAFVTAIVLIGMGKIRPAFAPPEPGGSVFLESFALFAGGFLVLVFGIDLLARVVNDEVWLTVIQLVAQWVLLACPLWPLMRGMRWNAFCRAIGWHRGRGVFREIGAGVVGYFAGLPLLAMGMGIALGLAALVSLWRLGRGLGEAPPPSNAVFELAGSQNPALLLAVFLLATVWAPLCEESIFRGALYRHLRGRVGVVASAIVSALVFGLCHQYGPVLVMPVVMLGVTFALMREWRGSLIASITAHAMHNATVTIVLFSVIRVIG